MMAATLLFQSDRERRLHACQLSRARPAALTLCPVAMWSSPVYGATDDVGRLTTDGASAARRDSETLHGRRDVRSGLRAQF
jgi:hypothetical protein